jgi:hypothetical protein
MGILRSGLGTRKKHTLIGRRRTNRKASKSTRKGLKNQTRNRLGRPEGNHRSFDHFLQSNLPKNRVKIGANPQAIFVQIRRHFGSESILATLGFSHRKSCLRKSNFC